MPRPATVVMEEDEDAEGEPVEEVFAEDVLTMLIATDIHLGFAEQDAERGEDSFRTFEEILQVARSEEVDMVLLGGDLFHESNPSRQAVVRSDRLIEGTLIYWLDLDEGVGGAEEEEKWLNFEDDRVNVRLPVFSISGNHDDPSGLGSYSALDEFQACHLVNYFGKSLELDNIRVLPLVLNKGGTNVCLYGTNYINDQRLRNMFRQGKISYIFPPNTDDSTFFHINVLHQNRAQRDGKKFIKPSFLDDRFNLILWGHEHECISTMEVVPGKDFFILQPGSSVATSLCEGEAVPKHVFVVRIHKKKLQYDAIPLQTVRPFVMEDLLLDEALQPLMSQENLESRSFEVSVKEAKKKKEAELSRLIVERKLNKMIKEAESQLSGHEAQPRLPLIRLRVFHSLGEDPFHPVTFSAQWEGRVANRTGMVLFKRNRGKSERSDESYVNPDVLSELMSKQALGEQLQKFVEDYFKNVETEREAETVAGNPGLSVLSQYGLSWAVERTVGHGEKRALSRIVDHQVDKAKDYIHSNPDVTMENLHVALDSFRESRAKQPVQVEELEAVLSQAPAPTEYDSDDDLGVGGGALSEEEPNEEEEEQERGRRAPAGRARGRVSVWAQGADPQARVRQGGVAPGALGGAGGEGQWRRLPRWRPHSGAEERRREAPGCRRETTTLETTSGDVSENQDSSTKSGDFLGKEERLIAQTM
ncbi:unnamed protein product [Cyprideis torosa]|uniref:Double-strand break repair protein n=1 Tax=Cyprideis torosa TaxID=163714 RepID=A0A7R8ZR14_9CRUS|nr:unnamed protein product [Cyprideis torosa]CAG0891948.1 unnamed protein product [Cyprideis torosa]